MDGPPLHDSPECAGAPRRAQHVAQAVVRVVHLMTRTRLAENADPTVAQPKRFPARLLEIDVTQEDIGAPSRRIDLHPELDLRLGPRSLIDERHLPPAALIGVSAQTTARNHLRFNDAIHRPAVCALDPDGNDLTHLDHLPFSACSLIARSQLRRMMSLPG